MTHPAAYQQIPFAVEILRLGEIGKDIVFLFYKGEVEGAGP